MRSLLLHATAALAALLAIAAPAAWAETILAGTPVWTSPVHNTFGIALGDVDGDGDLDLIRASLRDATTLTLNVGGVFATTPVWSESAEHTRCVALGDVDGDGDLDLVRGNDGNEKPSLYRNVGGTFESTPVWTGVGQSTRSISLADLDGDADLDLVSGNDTQGATLYLNQGGTFGTTPDWTGPIATSNGLAIGDVDGDGRLDLVFGNFSQPSTLFLNSPAGFAMNPDWSGPAEPTRGVALGDVDGDGDLDLVRGNRGAGSTLTLNNGGLFEAAPVWTGPVETTWAVALGDLDADGDLDLVRGNSGAATLSLNNGTPFSAAPDWSGPAEDSRHLALGDVDGDGDLDLVRGNMDQASTLYLNVSSPLEPSPAWAPAGEDTRAVAVGDVDGDGDLDLVRGNVSVGTTLYRNVGGQLETSPAWTGPTENTLAVALGDVDGDGDLDLVRGNFGQGSTLYLNSGGTFTTAPAWTGPIEDTNALALGDVDRDGDLDLVRSSRGQSATLYLNVGGTFGALPGDSIGLVEATRDVALADIDGDDDLDLVRGNDSQGSTLYRNVGGIFENSPAWVGPFEATQSISLGDVNGDGRPDLVRGNKDQGATLYLNQGTTFASAPVWVGPTESTHSVALGDLDGDGDLDLLRGNLSQAATMYLNNSGTFTAQPAESIATDSTWSATLADLDADGDLDAFAGNVGLYRNRSFWNGRGLTGNRLPNNPAHLRWTTADAIGTNQVRIAFQAVDVESDPVRLVAEYQFQGTPTWYAMDTGSSGSFAGPFTTSPAGLPHEFTWNVTTIPFDPRDAVIRMRTLSPSAGLGGPAFETSYLRAAGRVVPVRPSLEASPASLAFPTVTVGDTSVASLSISNGGNLDLVIQSLTTPSAEIVANASPGLTVPPGTDSLVTLYFAPRSPPPTLDPIHITANDPARPSLDIGVVTDVRDLVFQSQLLAVAPELPLGEAATVVVTPGSQVRIEGGFVLFRFHGAAAFTDSSALVPQGSNFIALIPSQAVTEVGLDYYVRVENSGVTRTFPPGAPADFVHYPVAPPTSVVATTAIPDARDEFPAGRATPVVVTLPSGALFRNGALYYRAGGAAAFDSVALESREISPGIHAPPEAFVPGDSVGARGIEFWVRVRTDTTSLLDPRFAPAIIKNVRVTVDSLAEPTSHPAARYRLVTVPLELDLPVGASLEALLSDQPEFGTPDVTRWRAYRYSPATSGYLEVTGGTADALLHPEPGRAFWLIASSPNRVNTAPVRGRSTPTGAAFHIPLEPGWNQIGNPYLFPVAWSDVPATGPSGPVTLEPPVGWDESAHVYRAMDVSTLLPFEGYWVMNSTGVPVDLAVPPWEAPATVAGAMRGEQAEGHVWGVGIEVSCGGMRDGHNIAGVHDRAAEGRDPLDRSDPPVSPGSGLSLYFLDPTDTDRIARAVDVRPPIGGASTSAQGRRWVFDVVRSGDQPPSADALLSFLPDSLPPGLTLRLVDRTLGRAVDLTAEASYAFVSTRRTRVGRAAEARFELVAGDSEYVEGSGRGMPVLQTRLLPVFPSPMRSAATIRFEVAREGPVRLEVFDVAGRRVRELVNEHRAAGIHELSWGGRDDGGRTLAPGVYMVRIVTSDRRDERRVVKLP